MKVRLIFSAVILTVLSSCGIFGVRLGMTEAQVTRLVGEPVSINCPAVICLYEYEDQDMLVRFKDGKVVGFTSKNWRPNGKVPKSLERYQE